MSTKEERAAKQVRIAQLRRQATDDEINRAFELIYDVDGESEFDATTDEVIAFQVSARLYDESQDKSKEKHGIGYAPANLEELQLMIEQIGGLRNLIDYLMPASHERLAKRQLGRTTPNPRG